VSKSKKAKTTIANYTDLDLRLLELGSIETEVAEKEADMNAELQQIREKYAKLNEENLEKKKELVIDIELFCIENKDQFEKVKSKELTHGKIGFRFPPPKVVLLNRSYAWDTVANLLMKLYKDKYVRVVHEPNKEKILADSFGEKKLLNKDDLAGVGLRIEQKEKFYYEIKWESIEKQGK
jgi:phage host-nuclease inhibitor protein Gam